MLADWQALLGAAEAVRVNWYFLEMEVADARETLDALVDSLAFLRRAPLSRACVMT